MRKIILLTILFYIGFQNSYAQPAGSLDSSFGNNGIINSPLGAARATGLQSNGKILLAGASGISRYNTDGTVDHTFGNNGTQPDDFTIGSLAVESNDKFVVAADVDTSFLVARYNRDGSADSTFNGTGKQTTGFGLTDYFGFTSVTIQQDGKIIVASHGNTLVLVRYNINGSLDSTFNGSGKLNINIPPGSASTKCVTVQTDGKIVIVGSDAISGNMEVLRFNTDGSRDNTFGINGSKTVDFPNAYSNSVAISKSGKIVISGGLNIYYPSENTVMCVVQLNSDGTLDSSFSGDGKQFMDINIWKFGAFNYSLGIQDDGKILIGGEKFGNDPRHFIIVRYSTNGNVDSTFSDDGIAEIPITDPYIDAFVSDFAISKNKLYAVIYPLGLASFQLGGANVRITNPKNDSAFIGPATITINASAYNPAAIIKKVRFYNGSILIGIDSTSPYSFNWTNVSFGAYTLIAKAFDSNGDSVSSLPLKVSVVTSQPPTISFLSPADSASFESPATISLHVKAADLQAGGAVAKVEFFNGSTLLATVYDSPYVFNWTNVQTGPYLITATATDNSGLTTSAVINIAVHGAGPKFGFTINGKNVFNVNNGISDPSESDTVSVCSTGEYTTSDYFHSSGYNYYNSTITLSGSGTLDFDGFNPPANNVIAAVTLSSLAGARTIHLENPNYGATVVQTLTPFLDVDKSGSLTAADITGDPIVITYIGYAEHTWYLDADGDGRASETTRACSSPGTGWTLTPLPVDDCNDSDTTPCNRPPLISITTPQSGTNYVTPGPIRLSADASDPDNPIKSVAFYNGSTLLFTDTTAPYTGLWNDVATGNYYLTAVAITSNGLKTTSATVHITVLHNRPPVVNITSPADSTSYTAPATIVLSADATAHGGKIKTVQFYNGTTLIHTESNPPYTWTWNKISAGNYAITAKATDTYGRKSVSSPVHIKVIRVCTEASEPTFGFNFNGTPTANVNNGKKDSGESASVTLCNGGQYFTSGHYNSSPLNLYSITDVFSGGTLLFNGAPTSGSVITAPELTHTAGTYTITLDNPNIGGTVVQTITPFTDLNNNRMLDDGDCAGDPVVYTYVVTPCTSTCTPATQPTFSYDFNGTIVGNINNGIPDSSEYASVTVCNGGTYNESGHVHSSAGNLYDLAVTSSGGTVLINGVVPASAVINAATFSSFEGAETLTLADPNVGGSFVQKITPFTDLNNNGILDSGDCAGDPVVETFTVNTCTTPCPASSQPAFTYNFNGITVGNINNGVRDSSEYARVTVCNGGQYTESGHTNSSPDNLYDVKDSLIGGTLLVNGYVFASAVFTADQFSATSGTETLTLANPNAGGAILQKITPFTDLNNDGILDAGDCAGDPVIELFTVNTCTDSCPASSKPTLTYNFNGTIVGNINNGVRDSGEYASVTVCNGGQYTETGFVHSSSSNLYDLSVTSSGGTLLFNGYVAANAVITAAEYTSFAGTQTATLADPNVGGTVVQTITPFTDLNNDGILDAGDCAGDPIVETYTVIPCTATCTPASEPTFGFDFNGTQTANINNGTVDSSEFASVNVCDGGQYFISGHFSSSSSNLYNVADVFSGGTLLFNGYPTYSSVITANELNGTAGTYTITLAEPGVGGTVVQTITPFRDVNNNGILDDSDCAGDPIVYSYTVTPCSGANGISLNKQPDINSKADLFGNISLKIAPDPVHTTLNISTTGLQKNKQTTLSLISSSGVFMKTLQISSSAQMIPLNVSSFKSGMYIIKMISGDKVIYKQFIKL